MGRFVGEFGQKTAKTTTIFKPISPTLDFKKKICWHGCNRRHLKHNKEWRRKVNFLFDF